MSDWLRYTGWRAVVFGVPALFWLVRKIVKRGKQVTDTLTLACLRKSDDT